MFITMEGIEGSGKTTQMDHIAAFLHDKGHDYIVTREPGGTDIGRKIRSILLDSSSKSMDPAAELLLYLADRVQHLHEVVMPALNHGKIVLSDRYMDATLAYQGYARGLSIDMIYQMHRVVGGDLRPDVTFLLDLPPAIGLKRAWEQIKNGNRNDLETRFEEEHLIFHERVRNGYLALSRLEPERFQVIDASLNEENVRQAICHVLNARLRNMECLHEKFNIGPHR